MAEMATASGCYSLGDVLDTSAGERGHLYHALLMTKGSRAWATRKISDSRAGPRRSQHEGRTNPMIYGFGEILLPRWEAADLLSATFRGGRSSEPPYPPFLAPRTREGPGAPQDTVCRRADNGEKSRQTGRGADTCPQHRAACIALPHIHHCRGCRRGLQENLPERAGR